MSNNFLEITNVDFTIGGKIKVKNVSFSIENEGDIICLLGPSGIGKTTILRTIRKDPTNCRVVTSLLRMNLYRKVVTTVRKLQRITHIGGGTNIRPAESK